MKYFYFEQDPARCRASFAVTHLGQLNIGENSNWLDLNYLEQQGQRANHIDRKLQPAINNRELRAINQAHPRWQELAQPQTGKPPYAINLLACGDVGSTLLIGLKLLAGDTVSQIGIYDINPSLCKRWQFELNQISGPQGGVNMPQVQIITKEQLFACDVFIFCATAGVPELKDKSDVRLAQYQRNAAIIKEYALLARKQKFTGLFAVVSDPVDLLCQTALWESNRNSQGKFDGLGLFPEQIEGYGLGVMHARAKYYASQYPSLASYLNEGRAYGPHGNGLIIANSIANYDDVVSRQLTELAATANIKARELGFKPYVAPALSSGALAILATLRGQWHYSSTYLGGVFMGARNRRCLAGLELETLPLPELLKQRIQATTETLISLNESMVAAAQ